MANRTGKSSSKKVVSPVSPAAGEAERPAGLAKAGLSAGIPGVDDVPATAGMLRGLRTELFERIDQTKHELRAEVSQTKHELRAEIQGVKTELKADIYALSTTVNTTALRIDALEGEMRGLKAEMSGTRAEMGRMTVMMEEQSARNKVALDAITAWLDRQGRSEHRMDAVEETVRSLATSRPPRD